MDKTSEDLFNAVQANDTQGVRAALDAGSDVNARDDWGDTPLHRSAAEGKTDVAALLLARGADVHARDSYKYSAHMKELADWADQMGCMGGDSASDLAFERLEKERLTAPQTEAGRTAEMRAEQAGHTETVALLRATVEVHSLAATLDAVRPPAEPPAPVRLFAGPNEPVKRESILPPRGELGAPDPQPIKPGRMRL